MGQLMHCTKPGLFPFESDCQHFYRCKDEEGPLVNLANGIYQRGEIHELTLSSHACLQFNRCEFFFFIYPAELLRCPQGHAFDPTTGKCLREELLPPCQAEEEKLALVLLEYSPEEVKYASVLETP